MVLRGSDRLLIKHLRVNINMLLVCDQADRVTMDFFVRDESWMNFLSSALCEHRKNIHYK